MSIFGFSTEPSGGDFLPIVKYDARAGRMFRIDRVSTGDSYVSEQVDITGNFKAICDFENLEVGWISFAGGRPDFRLVPMGSPLPARPMGVDDKGKQLYTTGVRFMMKLSKDCGGEKPIREIAGVAKVFLGAVEQTVTQYLAQKDANPGKLPVLTMKGTTPVTSGTGAQKSTNYAPIFEIAGWAPRGDLVFVPKGGAAPTQPASNGAAAPATGSTQVDPPAPAPAAPQPETVSADDFG